MRSEFKLRFLLVPLLAFAAAAWSQTCPVPIPSAPPAPRFLVINVPADGGTQGCTAYAQCDGCKGTPSTIAIGNAKCATAVAIAQQLVANDNGWNDGGTP